MRWFKRTASVGAVVGLVSLSLVVSAAPASAWSTPTMPDAPPRISAPEPTALKPGTTGLTPKFLLKKIPIAGLALELDSMVVNWLSGVTGNSSNPTLGCVGTDGKISEAACSAPDPKPATAPNNGLVVPDLLWGAITGKNLNPLLEGAAPPNWSVSQAKPHFAAPANGKPGWINMGFTGKRGELCTAHPTWHSCPAAEGWKGDVSSWGNSQWQARVQCRVVANGGLLGAWNGSGNNPKGHTGGWGNLTADNKDYQVCRDDGSQVVDFVKGMARPAPYDFAPSWAPGVWVNPAADVYKDTVFTSNLTCKNSSGGSVTVTKTGTAGTGIIPTVQCPAGYLPDSGNTSVGSAFLDAPQKVEEWQITPETREAYPDCIGWQSAGCIMRVELDGVDCTPGNPACYDWAEIQRLQPSRVKCKWGSYTIDISNCLPLRNGYQSESGISAAPSQAPGTAPLGRDVFGRPVQPNADPLAPPQWQPDYGTPTNPAPTTGGSGLTDPAPIPQLPPAPAPDPNQPPLPIPPVSTNPNSEDSKCWPEGSAAFNPLNWVLQPVKCALNWAFVPKKDVASRGQAATGAFQNKAPMNWFLGAGALTAGAAAMGSAGCPAWIIQVENLSENVVCESSFTQAIVSSRGMLFGGMVIAMFWPLIRALWYSVIPIFRPSPAQ